MSTTKERKKRVPIVPKAPLYPGQILMIPKTRVPKNKVLAAIETGKGLIAAAEEVAGADSIDFDDQHLKSLIEWLEAKIMGYREMQRALEAHYQKRLEAAEVT